MSSNCQITVRPIAGFTQYGNVKRSRVKHAPRPCVRGYSRAEVGLGPSEDETAGLLVHSAVDHQGPAEVAPDMPRRMRQRHEHLSGPAAALAHVFRDDGVSAVEAVLVPEPLEDVLGGGRCFPGS